jgi:hypothetical protein
MLFKNITKKKDARERIFQTTQAMFVIELRANIVEDLEKLASSTIVVRIHPQNHPHFAYRNSLQQIYAPVYFLFFVLKGRGGCICVLYCSIY